MVKAIAMAAVAALCFGGAAGPATSPERPGSTTLPASLRPGEAFRFEGNPLVRDAFTADPAVLVHGGRLYLYTGHDEAPPGSRDFVMNDWRCYSTDDMVTWRFEGTPLRAADFAWARGAAFASQVVERGGKFYWYAPVWPKAGGGFSIGVAVGDSPAGPFKDAIGRPLITNEMTPTTPPMGHDDIDPTVLVDDDGQAYLIWGNTYCHLARLKANMTELDGPIERIDLPAFTEAPWLHKYKGKYYLSFAQRWPEVIAFATADKVTGPYTFRGVINETMPACPTNHQAIVEFNGKWWFIYHGAPLSGFQYRRSVGFDELKYADDGSILPIARTGDWPPPPPPSTTRPEGR